MPRRGSAPRRVRVRWRVRSGRILEAEVRLLDDSDPVYPVGEDGEPDLQAPRDVLIAADGSEVTEATVGALSAGGRFVMFEDDEGIFGLLPRQIIDVTPVEP